ncbi:SH3 domain-containing protein [Govanella unica]|uniref:SH3 domain-containing protein n=1 Tax=Govanella unica TaxID=2975056 RepID=A0A9X3Z6Q0_9PROT|nr:SH3 domain-containing protein [Govania unica]MDA5193248.1 SH3 domain-containing protein [Govania unica]
MLYRSIAVAALLASAVFLPEMATAATAVTIGTVSLRAGPDAGYPLVRTIHDDRPVQIYGCLNDWSWCDVGYSGDRGWLDGNYIASDYQGRRQPLIGIGAMLGLGIVSFDFGNYWDSYYRGRPFYSERGRWENHYHTNYKSSWGPRATHNDNQHPSRMQPQERHPEMQEHMQNRPHEERREPGQEEHKPDR